MTYRLILLFIISMVLNINNAIAGELIFISDESHIVTIEKQCAVFEDKDKVLDYNKIISPEIQKRFKPNKKSSLNFGFTKAAIWVKCKVVNKTNNTDWLLEIGWAKLDNVKLYIQHNGELIVKEFDRTQPHTHNEMNHRKPMFQLNLTKNTEYDVYLRVESVPSISLPVKIFSKEKFIDFLLRETYLLSACYGMLLIMAVYNLFIGLNTRDKTYIYYGFTVFFVCFYLAATQGIGYKVFWPNSPWWNQRSLIFLTGMFFFWWLMFSREFLKLWRYTWLNAIFLGMAAISFIYTWLIWFYNPFMMIFPNIKGVVILIVCIIAGMVSVLKKERMGFFYVGSYTLLFIGAGLLVLMQLGVLPFVPATAHGLLIGTVLQTTLLSFALADRINTMQKKLVNLNVNLESIIEERTSQLKKVQEKNLLRAHQAGMADIARNTLHSTGNAINSVLITIDSILSTNNSVLENLRKANKVLKENENNLTEFFSSEKGKKLAEFYAIFEIEVNKTKDKVFDNIKNLRTLVETLAGIVERQKQYLHYESFDEEVDFNEIVDYVLAINNDKITNKTEITKNYVDECTLKTQKSKLLYILDCMVKNACDAMEETQHKQLSFGMKQDTSGENIIFSIKDNGSGIDKDLLTQIFAENYTTKHDRVGMGLHESANYVVELGGKIWAKSDGKNTGAEFCVQVPNKR